MRRSRFSQFLPFRAGIRLSWEQHEEGMTETDIYISLGRKNFTIVGVALT